MVCGAVCALGCGRGAQMWKQVSTAKPGASLKSRVLAHELFPKVLRVYLLLCMSGWCM